MLFNQMLSGLYLVIGFEVALAAFAAAMICFVLHSQKSFL
jgi:uncharacterized membrane protein YphA (DoxX/SURF4 family)